MRLTTDNRNLAEMTDYQQDRIEALLRRIKELEQENTDLEREARKARKAAKGKAN